MKNRSLMEGEDGSGDEDARLEGNEVDGPPAKRARTGRVTLDSDETAFASSLPPLRPTPGAMSQYKNVDSDSQGSDGDGDGTARREREESDEADGDLEVGDGDGSREYDQEGVGFQDNGVCSHFFLPKLPKLIIHP